MIVIKIDLRPFFRQRIHLLTLFLKKITRNYEKSRILVIESNRTFSSSWKKTPNCCKYFNSIRPDFRFICCHEICWNFRWSNIIHDETHLNSLKNYSLTAFDRHTNFSVFIIFSGISELKEQDAVFDMTQQLIKKEHFSTLICIFR